MASSKRSKKSKWQLGLSYIVLLGLVGLFGYLGITAPKVNKKLLLANGEVFSPSQRCLETGEPELSIIMRDALASSEAKGWMSFHPVVIPITNLWSKRAGAVTLASSVTTYFVDPSKGNQHGTRFLRALKLEWTVRKCALFELYASKIYFGKQRFGTVAAAKGFFSKEPVNLSISQAAFLAAITRGPSVYLEPNWFHRTIFYRNKIIDRMNKRGLITKQQAKLAKQEPLQFH